MEKINEEMIDEEIERDRGLLEILKDEPIIVGEFSDKIIWNPSNLKVVLIFNGDYGLRVLENMVNSIGHCVSCGHLCIEKQCKYGKYGFANNIIGVYELEDPESLPQVIDDPYKYLPRKLPNADIVLATGLHNDLYMELPELLRKSDIKALIIFREDPKDAPLGVVREIYDLCKDYGIEFEAPKPSCILRPNNKTIINQFIREFRLGKPLLEIELAQIADIKKIVSVKIYVSAPCGTTWYVARQILNYEFKSFDEDELRKFYDYIALHHHAAPCIGSMLYDHEIGDTILHWGSYIEREAYLRALGLNKQLRDTIRERLKRKYPT